ncbi:hypothetical protein JHK82_040317 [Glycine max]|nr:hypothetical protein JHK82_040317 [Glycine max]
MQGHSQGISTIKFSPDGHWVVSGGFDSVLKVWDLTGGKLLHDFKFHKGHIGVRVEPYSGGLETEKKESTE